MYKTNGMPHYARVYGQDLAKDLALPLNVSINGAWVALAHTEGAIEVVARAAAAGLSIADTKALTVKLQTKGLTDADGAAVDLPTFVNLVAAAGSGAKAKGTELGRYVIPTSAKTLIRAVVATTDAAATGAIDIIPTYLPR